MKSSYEIIIQRNLDQLFGADLEERALAMGARKDGQALALTAFGAPCRLSPSEIHLDGRVQTGPLGVVISLYGLHAVTEAIHQEPFKAFKELPDSAPYVGAFTSHTEQILVPKVDRIIKNRETIMERLQGRPASPAVGGDDSMVVQPLPKILLCYIFYAADEDFPASATCLYSHNAHRFMPVDGLADVAEYTSRAILALLDPPHRPA